jgi:hypothetical protein
LAGGCQETTDSTVSKFSGFLLRKRRFHWESAGARSVCRSNSTFAGHARIALALRFGTIWGPGPGPARCIVSGKGALLGGLGGAKRGFGGKTLGLKAVLFAAIFFFGTLGESLALGISSLAQTFEALTFGLIGGLQALAKHSKEVRAARSQHTETNVADALTVFAGYLVLDALAQHVEESVGR